MGESPIITPVANGGANTSSSIRPTYNSYSTMNNQATQEEVDAIRQLESKKINWRDGISIYEGKASVLIMGAILSLLFSLVMYAIKGDISANLTLIVQTFIVSIAGVNAANSILSLFKK